MLCLTPSDEANRLLTTDPFALLVGMLLDQQIPMERAFAGPHLLAERLGTPDRLDPAVVAATSDEELLKLAQGPPAIHRFPGSMVARIKVLAQMVLDDYDGDAAAVWRSARTGKEALANLQALPGFGEVKAKIFLSLIGKQLGEAPRGWKVACEPYSKQGTTMSVADVTSPETLLQVREWKKNRKAKG